MSQSQRVWLVTIGMLNCLRGKAEHPTKCAIADYLRDTYEGIMDLKITNDHIRIKLREGWYTFVIDPEIRRFQQLFDAARKLGDWDPVLEMLPLRFELDFSKAEFAEAEEKKRVTREKHEPVGPTKKHPPITRDVFYFVKKYNDLGGATAIEAAEATGYELSKVQRALRGGLKKLFIDEGGRYVTTDSDINMAYRRWNRWGGRAPA